MHTNVAGGKRQVYVCTTPPAQGTLTDFNLLLSSADRIIHTAHRGWGSRGHGRKEVQSRNPGPHTELRRGCFIHGCQVDPATADSLTFISG